jgi:hypothetical protein
MPQGGRSPLSCVPAKKSRCSSERRPREKQSRSRPTGSPIASLRRWGTPISFCPTFQATGNARCCGPATNIVDGRAILGQRHGPFRGDWAHIRRNLPPLAGLGMRGRTILSVNEAGRESLFVVLVGRTGLSVLQANRSHHALSSSSARGKASKFSRPKSLKNRSVVE